MKNKPYTLNLLLTAVLGIVMVVFILIRTFSPASFLPEWDVPTMAMVSLVALVLDHYLAPGVKRCYLCIAILSALTFGLLPFGACFVDLASALRMGLMGGIVFTAITWLYTSAMDRLSSGPNAKAAPIVCAVGLYLAVQAMAGMML